MKNPMKLPKIDSEAKIKVCGVEYTLRYDLGALDAFETKRDQSVAEVFKESLNEKGEVKLDSEGRPIVPIRTGVLIDLLWAGLLAYHGFSREEVGHLFGFTDLQATSVDMMKAMSAANQSHFPKDETIKESPLRKK
jgi:hypothetical protein